MSETPTTPTELDAIPSQEEWLIAEDIQIDHTYQRPASDRWVKKIADNFDPFLLDSLIVNRRADGSLYVMDGQHRLLALRRIGYGDQKVPCRVFVGLPPEKEAELFDTQTLTLRLKPGEKFKAKLRQREPAAVTIDGIVRGCGFALNLVDGELTGGRICAISALERVYRNYHAGGLNEVLTIIADGFGTDVGPRDMVIGGVAKFHVRYRAEYDRKRLIAVLRETTLNSLGAKGTDFARTLGIQTQDGVGRAILSIYNYRLLSDRRLESWELRDAKSRRSKAG